MNKEIEKKLKLTTSYHCYRGGENIFFYTEDSKTGNSYPIVAEMLPDNIGEDAEIEVNVKVTIKKKGKKFKNPWT